MFESWAIVGPYPSWWLFNILLLVLQVLHIIWSYLIARIAVKAVLRGKVSRQKNTNWLKCDPSVFNQLNKTFFLFVF